MVINLPSALVLTIELYSLIIGRLGTENREGFMLIAYIIKQIFL
jgi:hypothetical protein